MGKGSTRVNKTEYQKAREESGLTVMSATDKINEAYKDYRITDYRITRIENETVAAQPIDVVAMSIGYNKPELRNYYCTQKCPIGQKDTPVVKFDSSVHEILVNMAVTLENVQKDKMRLMEILADGKIDDTEKKDFDKINEELEQISATVEALQLWCEKYRNQ